MRTTVRIFAVPQHRVFILAATIAVTMLVVCSPAAFAQKNSPTQPPVTIVVDFDGFEYRPDLGGVYDTRRGIVWGYSLVAVAGMQTNQTWAKNTLPGIYDDLMESAGNAALAGGDLDAAAAYYDAAAIAASASNWRLPTLVESRNAVSRGLFTYGAGGLDMWTGSPADTVFGVPYGGNPRWTSDTGKWKGITSGWAFSPLDGGAALIGVNSGIDAIMVRSYTGP